MRLREIKAPNFQGDKAIWVIMALLSLVSLLAVYSSTSALALRLQDGNTEYYAFKHLVLLAMGWGAMYFVHRIDYKFFGKISNILLLVSVVLLIFALVQPAVNDANRWIHVFGFSFQPSDLAKFSLMIYLARVLAQNQEKIRGLYSGFLPILSVMLLICGLIAPANLSTALLIFSCSAILMYTAGVRAKYLAVFGLIGVMGLGVLLHTVDRAQTWRNRFSAYTERLTNADAELTYQTEQSFIAIATGGAVGKGAGKSVQRNFLPHPYSDFIFSIIIEEYGFAGAFVIALLYMLLLFRILMIVTISRTFGALLCLGFGLIITLQALVNMGVSVGALPITGLPLPLVSMGGTSIIFTCLSLGVVLSVSRSAYARSAEDETPALTPA